MSMVAGNVSINPVTGVETYTPPSGPNLAKELYLARTASVNFANPANPPKSTTTAGSAIGATSFTVDQTLGLTVGHQIGTDFGATSNFIGNTYQSTITALGPTTLTLADPAPVAFPIGQVFGFQGSSGSWSSQATPVLVQQKKTFASAANADAATIVAHIVANAITSGGQTIT